MLLACLLTQHGNLRLGQRRHDLIAHPARTLALGQQAAREADSRSAQIALDHGIDEAQRQGVGSTHRLAIQEHLQRIFGADQARQTLRAHSTGDDAQGDLGKAQLGVLISDAIVRGQCHFDATTQRCAMQSHHSRLR